MGGQQKKQGGNKRGRQKGGRQQQPDTGLRVLQDVADEQLEPLLDHLQSLAPMDRVNAIKPWWSEQSQDRRASLLTVDVELLRGAARDMEEAARRQLADAPRWQSEIASDTDPFLAEQMQMRAVLEEALEQLRKRGSWKVWHCHLDNSSFYDAEAFRTHMVTQHLDSQLKELLPKLDVKENDSEEGLRKRMTELMDRISAIHHRLHRSCCDHYYAGCCAPPGACAWCQSSASGSSNGVGSGGSSLKPFAAVGGGPGNVWQQWQDVGPGGSGRRRGQNCSTRPCSRRQPPPSACSSSLDSSSACMCCCSDCSARELELEITGSILDGLQQEHPYLRQLVLGPLLEYIDKALPEVEVSNRPGCLQLEDLGRLLPEDRLHICEWLTEKVDALCAQLKPNSKEEDEHDDMGDIDLWCLSPDGSSLMVNARWLQHLQQRLLSEDGPPRKSLPGEDPRSTGLVLEWVYGCIVSTAEKARDASQRCLSPAGPGLERAWGCLGEALKMQQRWSALLTDAQALLTELSAADAAVAAALFKAQQGLDWAEDEGQDMTKQRKGSQSQVQGQTRCKEQLCLDGSSGGQAQAWLLAAAADGVEPVLAAAAATAIGSMAAGTGAAGLTGSMSMPSIPWLGNEAMVAVLRLELARVRSVAHAAVCAASVTGQALSALCSWPRLYEPSMQGLTRQLEDCVAARTSAGSTTTGSSGSAAATARGGGMPGASPGAGGAAYERLLQLEALLRASVQRGAGGATSAAGAEKRRSLEEDLARRVLQLRQMSVQQANLERAAAALDQLLEAQRSVEACMVSKEPCSGCRAPTEAMNGCGKAECDKSAEAGPGQPDTCSGDSPASTAHHLAIARHRLRGDGSASSSSDAGMDAAEGQGQGDDQLHGTACANLHAGELKKPSKDASDADTVPEGWLAACMQSSSLPAPQHRQLSVIRLYFNAVVLPAALQSAVSTAGTATAAAVSKDTAKRAVECLSRAVADVQRVLEEGRAALSHLEMQVVNMSCDDPGATVGLQLVLPLLQQRFDLEAARHQQASVQDLCEQLIAEEEAEKKRQLQQQARKTQQQQQQQQQRQQQGKKGLRGMQQAASQQPQHHAPSWTQGVGPGGLLQQGGDVGKQPLQGAVLTTEWLLPKNEQVSEPVQMCVDDAGSAQPAAATPHRRTLATANMVSSMVSGNGSAGAPPCNSIGAGDAAANSSGAGGDGGGSGNGDSCKIGSSDSASSTCSCCSMASMDPVASAGSTGAASKAAHAACLTKVLASVVAAPPPPLPARILASQTPSKESVGNTAGQTPQGHLHQAKGREIRATPVTAASPPLNRKHADGRQVVENASCSVHASTSAAGAASDTLHRHICLQVRSESQQQGQEQRKGSMAAEVAHHTQQALVAGLAAGSAQLPPASPALHQQRGARPAAVAGCKAASAATIIAPALLAPITNSTEVAPRRLSLDHPLAPRPGQSSDTVSWRGMVGSSSVDNLLLAATAVGTVSKQVPSDAASPPSPQPPQQNLQTQPPMPSAFFSYFTQCSASTGGETEVTMPGELASVSSGHLTACRLQPPISPSLAAALPSSLMAEIGIVDLPCASPRAAHGKGNKDQPNAPVQTSCSVVGPPRVVSHPRTDVPSLVPWQLHVSDVHRHLGFVVGREHAQGITDTLQQQQQQRQRQQEQQHPAADTPPAHFLCPLTRQLMFVPVACSDGFLYEHKAISDWLSTSSVSPVTGQPLHDVQLIPVLPVRHAIMEWVRQRGCGWGRGC